MTESAVLPGVRRVLLTGFMGSGKTTVGRLLAGKLRWAFADLDDAVEQRCRKTVPQIFAEDGEQSFRSAEIAVLQKLLSRSQLVIALGGGAPGSAPLRALLAGAAHTSVIHLHAPFAVLYRRCQIQALDPTATERPLLRELSAAEKRYAERLPHYTSVAHFSADVEGGDPEGIAEALLHRLRDEARSAPR